MERTKEERRDDPIVVEMEPPWRGLTESSIILPSLWCVYAYGMGGGCVGEKERREGKERRGTSYHDQCKSEDSDSKQKRRVDKDRN